MRKAGIEIIETRDFFKHKGKAIYHTKTLVTDNYEAIAGGHNMLDADNTSRGTDFKNRDVDLYVKGPMVSDISKQFMENWNYNINVYGRARGRLTSMSDDYKRLLHKLHEERNAGLRGQHLYDQILGSKQKRMRGVCRFIKQAPHEDRHTVGKVYLKLLEKLQHHLVITNPITSDTLVTKISQRPLIDRFDNFDMFNLLHHKIQGIAHAGKKIDYITTNVEYGRK
jgi:phosphatidylserine/phosphatidylglycerophosphate/cardiolipin synthase-like enzyme